MESKPDTHSRLTNFLTLRVVFATLLLGIGAIIYFRTDSRNEAFLLLFIIILVYLHTFVYISLIQIFPSHIRWFKAALIGFDILVTSSVVALTGGKSSPFIFLYAIMIIVSSMMFSRIACYATATLSWLFYLVIVVYQTHKGLPHSSLGFQARLLLDESRLTYPLFNLAGFLLVAMLSGYLSQRIRETGRQLVERSENLRSLQNLHENILQSITSGVITLDLTGRVISINKMAQRLLDLKEEAEAIGRKIEELIPNIELSSLTARSRDEIKYVSSDGKTLIFGFSASTLMDAEGVSQGYIIVFQDLTEVKDLEERLRKTEKFALLGQLAAGLAHEIRNPLSAISGALEVISKEEEISRENSRLISIATSEIDKLHYLLEDFLILTNPSRHSDVVVEINRMVRETVDAFMAAVRRDDIEIIMELSNRELFVQANPHRLKQVVWNMLQNAKQAMPRGGRVFIETGLEGEEVCINIRDEGVGIESNDLPKIFEPFFTTKEVGTGLGLTIAQQVVDSYNGRIEVRSSRNMGTTFVVRLPSFSEAIGYAERV